VIGVGSAVIGGAGKTPVVQALAGQLAARGARVAVVAHAYGATPGRARRVRAEDSVDEVGDDALVLASCLPLSVPVYAAPRKQAAIDLAASEADVIVIDGLLQTRPERISLSLLVLDACHPWGSGVCLPGGDLRAAPRTLLSAADRAVLVQDQAQKYAPTGFRDALRAYLCLDTVRVSGRTLKICDIKEARLGLLLLVARPQRVEASLAARGIVPVCRWYGGDHRAPGHWDRQGIERMARRNRLDGWLVTPKCATHLSVAPGAPLWVMQATVDLDPRPLTVVDSRPCARQTFSMHC